MNIKVLIFVDVFRYRLLEFLLMVFVFLVNIWGYLLALVYVHNLVGVCRVIMLYGT